SEPLGMSLAKSLPCAFDPSAQVGWDLRGPFEEWLLKEFGLPSSMVEAHVFMLANGVGRGGTTKAGFNFDLVASLLRRQHGAASPQNAGIDRRAALRFRDYGRLFLEHGRFQRLDG